MVEALKKIDKKILIIVGIILLSPILLIIFLAIFRSCGNSKITYDKYEEKMITATENYIKGKEPKEEGQMIMVELSDLVEGGYIKSTEKLLSDTTCKGSVTVRRNGASIEQTKGGYLNYTVNLECDNHKTNTLKSNVMNDLVTQGNGLYELNGRYVFKGDKVNNYIEFFGIPYRILNIDSNGYAKLFKVENQDLDRVWDNKYNINSDYLSGINVYSDSAIKEYLINDYISEKNFGEKSRKHLVATDVCIDSKGYNDGTLNKYNCSTKVEKQLISLIDIEDYALASLDVNCTGLYSKSCINYNYFKGISLLTWTMNSSKDNTYDVYYIQDGSIDSKTASKYVDYNLVIYIDINEKIVSGNGTEMEPYIIK